MDLTAFPRVEDQERGKDPDMFIEWSMNGRREVTYIKRREI